MTVTIQKKGEYQDIRDQLRKRIDLLDTMMGDAQHKFAVEQEKLISEHKVKIDGFKSLIAKYRGMLELEESFAKSILQAQDLVGPQPEGAKVQMTIPKAKIPLADFLISKIEAKGSMSKEELRAAALEAGYFDEGDTGGRAVHATLINFIRNKRLSVSIDGLYSIAAAQAKEKSLL